MHAYPAGGSTGDDAAFAALCEQHRARLVAYCARRLGAHEAEDAAHEVLLRAYRAFAAFDASRDSWPWLRTVAGRVCTDMQRKAARLSSAGVVDKPATEDVHEQMAARMRTEIVDDALERLSPRYRSALVLREFGGWSYDDIAQVQGRSRASVRSILTRGRRRLGSHVETVARSRNEWPLPAALQPLRRLREGLRSLRFAAERSGTALGMAVELSAVAARMMIAAPAIAGVVSVASPLEAAHSLPSHPRPAAVAPDVIRPAAGVGGLEARPTGIKTTAASHAVRAASNAVAERQTLNEVSAAAPGDVEVSSAIQSSDSHLYVGIDEDHPLPVHNGDGQRMYIPCRHPAYTVACNTARTILPLVPSS